MKHLYNKVLHNATSTDRLFAGAGITAGVGTIYASGIEKQGNISRTRILVDLTGLNGGAAINDIIGVDATALPCHIGQILRDDSGTVFAGTITCLELPAGGNVDIDLYSATEGTGVEDGLVTDLTETLLCNSGNHTLGGVKILTAFPADGQYLYLTNGAATAATYTAGVLLIELFGVI